MGCLEIKEPEPDNIDEIRNKAKNEVKNMSLTETNKEINLLNTSFDFPELSMGMSSDYIEASRNLASYLRIGSSIFGKRV